MRFLIFILIFASGCYEPFGQRPYTFEYDITEITHNHSDYYYIEIRSHIPLESTTFTQEPNGYGSEIKEFRYYGGKYEVSSKIRKISDTLYCTSTDIHDNPYFFSSIIR